MDNRELQSVTQDFIFGTLATDELRLEAERARKKGVWHGSRITPLLPRSGDDVTFHVHVGSDVDVATIELMLMRDDSFPDDQSEIISFRRGDTSWDTLTWSYGEEWSVTVRARETDSIWRYRVRAITDLGETVWADANPTTDEPGVFAVAIDAPPDARWLRDAVIYHVFVDRFAANPGDELVPQQALDDIWGGTLKGVASRLDHIQHLGATAIWLSPIFPSPTHHGYDATDYTSIEPRLGTMEDLDGLVSACHSRGIRVILDFVANHVSNEHPDFLTALADPNAPEREFFTIHSDDSYETFFGVQSMPEVAVDHDAAAEWLIDAAKFWLDHGVDGYRLDYAVGPSLGFWTRFRHALLRRNPEVTLIGEAVDAASSLKAFRGRLDGTLDFLLLQQLRAWAGFDFINSEDFWRFLERHLRYFKDGPLLPSFLDNHDMNRFLWIVNGDMRRLKLAALLQTTLPGPPIIYYGTEVGLSQWHDLEYPDGSRRMEESRTPMLWGSDQNRDLLEFYRSAIFWRKKFHISGQNLRGVHAGDDGLLVYAVGPWLVALNRNEEDASIDLGRQGSTWLALATDHDVHLHGRSLQLPAMSGAIVAIEQHLPGHSR